MVRDLSLFLFKVKSGIANRWTINGIFMAVTFLRPAKSVTYGVTQSVPQNITKDVIKEKNLMSG